MKKNLNEEIIKYFVLTTATSCIEVAVFYLLIEFLNFMWMYATIISFVVAFSLNYVFSGSYVFKSENRIYDLRRYLISLMGSIAAFCIATLALYLMISIGYDMYLSKIGSLAVSFFVNFTIRKFVFS